MILEPAEDELILRGIEDPEDIVKWIRERRKKIGGREARLGDLAEVDLEGEFEDEGFC